MVLTFLPKKYDFSRNYEQFCGSETVHYGSGSGSGSDFSISSRSVSGSRSYFQKVPVSDSTFFLTKYDFKGPKMALQNIDFKE
jgi:hypothetical protein